MAKVAFVVVLALIALQNSNAAYLKPKHSNLRDGNDVEDLVQELKKTMEDLTSRGTKLDQEVDIKFSEIEKAVNLPGFFDETRQNVQKILEDGGPAAKNCQSYAWRNIAMLEHFTSVYMCRYFADEDVSDLRNQVLDLVYNLQDLLGELNEDMCDKCNQNKDDFSKCMEDKVIAIKQELEVMDKSIQDTFSKLETSMPMLTTKMTECMDGKKLGLVNRMKNVFENVQECIKANTVPSKKSGHFPNFLESMKEVQSKHNMDKIIMDLTQEVEELLSTNEKVERLCSPKAHDYVTEFSKETQAGAGLCEMTMNIGQPSIEQVMSDFDACLCRVEDKAYSKQQLIIDGLKQCIHNTEMLY